VFFVSVASKRVSWTVSLLFATLTGRFINVAAKGLRGTGRSKVPSRSGSSIEGRKFEELRKTPSPIPTGSGQEDEAIVR
jgi:hypothetical protein